MNKKKKKKTTGCCLTFTTGDPDLNMKFFNRYADDDSDNKSKDTSGDSLDAVNDAVADAGASTGADSGSTDAGVADTGASSEGNGDGAGMSESLKQKLTEKRETKRYYVRPQNIFCANKLDVLKALIDAGKQNCSVYTLKNLDDHDDVHQLTSDDIIYYYDNEVLYDKNHVKVMDYDLFIKHEEERKKFETDTDKVSKKDFVNEYDDRMTAETIVEDLKDKTEGLEEENMNTAVDYENAYNHRVEFLDINDRKYFNDIETSTNYEDILDLLTYGNVDMEIFKQYAGENASLEDFAAFICDKNSEWKDKDPFDLDWDDPEDTELGDFTESLIQENTPDEEETCCICGEPIQGYGNNPRPVKEEGRCCDACNLKFVIPARIRAMNNNEDQDHE